MSGAACQVRAEGSIHSFAVILTDVFNRAVPDLCRWLRLRNTAIMFVVGLGSKKASDGFNRVSTQVQPFQI